MKTLTNSECDSLIKEVFYIQYGTIGVLYTQRVSLEELRNIARRAFEAGQKTTLEPCAVFTGTDQQGVNHG